MGRQRSVTLNSARCGSGADGDQPRARRHRPCLGQRRPGVTAAFLGPGPRLSPCPSFLPLPSLGLSPQQGSRLCCRRGALDQHSTCRCRRRSGHGFGLQSPGREGPLEEEMAPPAAFLLGGSHGQRSLAGYSPRGCKELDTAERAQTHTVKEAAALLQGAFPLACFRSVQALSRV